MALLYHTFLLSSYSSAILKALYIINYFLQSASGDIKNSLWVVRTESNGT